jgi:hypothetical protein
MKWGLTEQENTMSNLAEHGTPARGSKFVSLGSPIQAVVQLIQITSLAVRNDQHVFDSHTTIKPSVQTRLDREDLSQQDFSSTMVQQNRFVEIQANSVARPVLDAGLIGRFATR